MKAFKSISDMSPEELKRSRERALIALPARFRDRCQRCGLELIERNGNCANKGIHADSAREFELYQAKQRKDAA